MVDTKIIEIRTTDGLLLPGLLYEPEQHTKQAAIYLHGNGNSSVFYSLADMNVLAEALNQAGIAYCAFNNRGAHVTHKLNRTLPDKTTSREPYGTAYELIAECVHDIDGAIEYLEKLGYEEFYLMGESTGANKICVYNHYKKINKISKYVLVSGGDDSGIYYDELGPAEFTTALEKARTEVSQGNGLEIPPHPSPISDSMGYISYQSILDTLDPDGDYNTFPFLDSFNKLHLSSKSLFAYYSEITIPSLIVYGSEDEYCYNNVPGVIDLLKKHKKPASEFVFAIIPDADHGLHGKYNELAAMAAAFCKTR